MRYIGRKLSDVNSISYSFPKANSLLYRVVEITNSSEIQNSEDLERYISEPNDLIANKVKTLVLKRFVLLGWGYGMVFELSG